MKPLLQILISVLLAMVICWMAYAVLEKGRKEYYSFTDDKLGELFENNSKFDVLFIGSSRTHTGINPKIIDSICNVNSFNAGVQGGKLLEFNMIFEAYLQNHPPPALLVLTLDVNSFDLRKPFFNYAQYYPFIKNRVIDRTLNNNGYNTIFIKLMPFIQLASYDDHTKINAIRGLKGEQEMGQGQHQYKGYVTNTKEFLKDTLMAVKKQEAYISPDAINILNNIIGLCNTHKIQLFFTYAPEFRKGTENGYLNKEQVFSLIKSIAGGNNIPYFKGDELPLCDNPQMFLNIGHLNSPGADAYSLILAKKINQEISISTASN